MQRKDIASPSRAAMTQSHRPRQIGSQAHIGSTAQANDKAQADHKDRHGETPYRESFAALCQQLQTTPIIGADGSQSCDFAYSDKLYGFMSLRRDQLIAQANYGPGGLLFAERSLDPAVGLEADDIADLAAMFSRAALEQRIGWLTQLRSQDAVHTNDILAAFNILTQSHLLMPTGLFKLCQLWPQLSIDSLLDRSPGKITSIELMLADLPSWHQTPSKRSKKSPAKTLAEQLVATTAQDLYERKIAVKSWRQLVDLVLGIDRQLIAQGQASLDFLEVAGHRAIVGFFGAAALPNSLAQ